MFKDKEEALRRLEAELLREEEEEEASDGAYDEEDYEADYDEDRYDEEYDEEEYDPDDEETEEDWEEEPARQGMPRGMVARVKAYNSDALEADLDEYSRKVYKARSRGRWVAAIALILLAALLLVLAFFTARNGGL
jgi:hypothetical protein